jgi:hypothetical protein
MRFHVAAILIASFAGVQAAEPKSAVITAKEFAAGWVSLFDGESDFGWKSDGSVTVKDGVMAFGAGQVTAVTSTAYFGPDFEMILEMKGGQVNVDGRQFTVANRMDLKPGVGEFRYVRDGRKREWSTNLGVEVADAPVKVGTNLVLSGTPNNPITLRSAKIRPTRTTSLFNGKDLTGWKRFTGDPKRELSKYNVTAAGELHVTNGSGDLQSVQSFTDFCLTLECKTNGDRLNSGLFFRCLPGQYQQGYEAQIHNGYRDNDRTKPTDFGTGAIYRRIPARKVVPNDREWFTMTVLAVGPRLRTWVNGYPTVDWVDERAENNNARSGRKLDGGPISIQGHDPTTDLLFRNIRIVDIEPPAKK